MARCPDLNEEDETEQNGYLVRSSEVGRMVAVTLFVTFVFSIKICGVVSSTKL
jgi:hypothetical protein